MIAISYLKIELFVEWSFYIKTDWNWHALAEVCPPALSAIIFYLCRERDLIENPMFVSNCQEYTKNHEPSS